MTTIPFDESKVARQPTGRFADQPHAEATGVDLDEAAVPPFTYGEVHGSYDEQIASEAAAADAAGADPLDTDASWTWSSITAEVGPAHAAELFAKTGGSTGAALPVAAQEWGEVTKDPASRASCIARGIKPSDFASADRNLRMAACSARGDKVFEGELLSGAYALTSLGPVHPDDTDRVIAPPVTVTMARGEDTPWSDLTNAEQISYLEGYASAAAAISYNRARATDDGRPEGWTRMALNDRGSKQRPGGQRARHAGFQRAMAAAYFEDEVDYGIYPQADTEISRGDAVGGAVRVRNVARVPGTAHSFTGQVIPGQRRWSDSGETVPWSGEARVRFEVDSYLRDVNVIPRLEATERV